MIRTEPTTTTAARPRCRALGAAGITGAQEKMPPSTPAPFEGGLTGSSSVDRARTGSKHHLLVDAGLPLAVTLAGTATTSFSCYRSSKASCPLEARSAAHASGPTGSPPTGATTTTLTGASYSAAASNR